MNKSLFIYDERKSALLRNKRGIGFEEIIEYIEGGYLVGNLLHPNQQKHPGQRIYEVNVEGYVYVIPFYLRGDTSELKTLYPSRIANKKHRKNL